MPHLRVEIIKAHNGIVRYGSAWCVEGVGPYRTPYAFEMRKLGVSHLVPW
jgi:hypothetical protein